MLDQLRAWWPVDETSIYRKMGAVCEHDGEVLLALSRFVCLWGLPMGDFQAAVVQSQRTPVSGHWPFEDSLNDLLPICIYIYIYSAGSRTLLAAASTSG